VVIKAIKTLYVWFKFILIRILHCSRVFFFLDYKIFEEIFIIFEGTLYPLMSFIRKRKGLIAIPKKRHKITWPPFLRNRHKTFPPPMPCGLHIFKLMIMVAFCLGWGASY